jgi:branched-chain amino acid transport system permease protein
MDSIFSFMPLLGSQILIGLSRTTILFIVSVGLSLVLGVLRIPNLTHGSLYMIGAFLTYTLHNTFLADKGFLFVGLGAVLVVGLMGFLMDRGIFNSFYEREHLMLILLTFALFMIFGDLTKLIFGVEYKSVPVPRPFRGFILLSSGIPFPFYNLFLVLLTPLVAFCLWFFVEKTKAGKIAKAAAVDRDMVSAVGINVGWVFCYVFVVGCILGGLGGVLISPVVSITLGMDGAILIDAFLIVIIGGLGNIWGTLIASLVFGLSQSIATLISPQFGIVIPYIVASIVLILRPKGLLRSIW